jgi:hypothetical protein
MDPLLKNWLLDQDPVIRYRVHRDLLDTKDEELRKFQNEMRSEGWGKQLMECQHPDGHWGLAYYQPKWTSTHYSLFLLRTFEYPADEPSVKSIIEKILAEMIGIGGGITPSLNYRHSECCITGMFFNAACYFHASQSKLETIVDYLLDQPLPDGGFNCRHPRNMVHHGSMHTTISVLEGLWEYERQGYRYRIGEIRAVRLKAQEFLLMHFLYLSDKDGRVIDPRFLSMHWPYHWHYDVMRALEYFCACDTFDHRLMPALDWLIHQGKHGKWPLSAPYAGKVHFKLDRSGKDSAINTVRALTILRKFKPLIVA